MQVRPGDRVAVRYTGRLDDGHIFDDNRAAAEPLEFVVGSGQVIEGFDEAVLGLMAGDGRQVRVPPDKAYGPRDERLVHVLDRALFEDEVSPGEAVDLEDESGQVHAALIVAADDATVTVDLNPALAGQTLLFDVTVERLERP